MRYARKLHICFVQYFQYNPDWFSVQIYYVHAFLQCLPAGIECPTIRLAVIKGYPQPL
jgi:hypothetical protein